MTVAALVVAATGVAALIGLDVRRVRSRPVPRPVCSRATCPVGCQVNPCRMGGPPDDYSPPPTP